MPRPSRVPLLVALAALVVLSFGCRTNRLAQVRPEIGAVRLAAVPGEGVDVYIGSTWSRGDPLEDMTLDATTWGIAQGLRGRIDAVVPPDDVEEAVFAAVREGFEDAFGAPLVARSSERHDAVLTVEPRRYGLYAADLNAPLEWFVEVRASLELVPGRIVVWETLERVSLPATPAAVIGAPVLGAGANVGIIAQLSDEQLEETLTNLASRAGRAVLRRLHHDARR